MNTEEMADNQADTAEMAQNKTDPIAELSAMTEIARALQPLDEDSVRRTLQWAADRFCTATAVNLAPSATAAAKVQPFEVPDEENEDSPAFETIADLYAAVEPKNDAEKAIIAAYWFQQLNGQDDFDAASANRELKHLGHAVSNITNALSNLMSRKPQLVIQTRKSGNSQQARKKYKLTSAGTGFVENMLSGGE